MGVGRVSLGRVACAQRSSSTSPAGTDTHSCTSSASALESAPLRMSRTRPASLRRGAGVADAHAAAVGGREPGPLGLLEQARARAGRLDAAAREANLAFAGARRETVQGRKLSLCTCSRRSGALPDRARGGDQRGRAADVDLGVQVIGVEAPQMRAGQVCSAAAAPSRVPTTWIPDVGPTPREPLELRPVGCSCASRREVQERDRAAVLLVQSVRSIASTGVMPLPPLSSSTRSGRVRGGRSRPRAGSVRAPSRGAPCGSGAGTRGRAGARGS